MRTSEKFTYQEVEPEVEIVREIQEEFNNQQT